MSMPGRMKCLAGGDIVPVAQRTIASASALPIPDVSNFYYVSGSTTVSTLSIPAYLRNREITLIGAANAAVTFTNNNSPTTAGQMYLRGADRLLQEDVVLKLIVKADGTAILSSFTG